MVYTFRGGSPCMRKVWLVTVRPFSPEPNQSITGYTTGPDEHQELDSHCCFD